PRTFTAEEAHIYEQHHEAQGLRRLSDGVGDRVRALDEEYKRKGWSPDSAWAGVSPHLFLQELNAKDPSTVSTRDSRRALSALAAFRQGNPDVFSGDKGRLAAA